MSNSTPDHQVKNLEANFSTLVLSIGSSAAMSLGLAPNPSTGQTEKNLEVARFNIDLLRMLREKTAKNLSNDEQKFLDSVTTDLQMKFVQNSK
jgi:uncharacterized protein YjaG (DUF416 family)